LTWLKEGGVNSKFFHGVMSSRRRVNAITNIVVNNVVVEGVSAIREAVFNHFENHFHSVNVVRYSIAILQFNSIRETNAYYLERSFAEDEVKRAVWECDSLKSHVLVEVNFGFIKEFWMDVKSDFMRFLLEFYSNSRLVKGSNFTFIFLIPKVVNPKKISKFLPISLV
jgi:hypothetical protein